MTLCHSAKIHSLLSRNKLSTEVGVFGLLVDFSAFLSAAKFAPLYLENETSLAAISSYLRITIAVVYKSGKKYLTSGSRVGGYSAPKKPPEPKVSKVLLIREATVPKCFASAAQTSFILHPTGPSNERPYAVENDPPGHPH